MEPYTKPLEKHHERNEILNKTSLTKKLDSIASEYPQHICKYGGTETEKSNACNHATKLYRLTCAIDDLWSLHLITKRTARSYGKILRQYEYYEDEAGLGHFAVFNGI